MSKQRILKNGKVQISLYLTGQINQELEQYIRDLKEDFKLEELPKKSTVISNLIDNALQFINST